LISINFLELLLERWIATTKNSRLIEEDRRVPSEARHAPLQPRSRRNSMTRRFASALAVAVGIFAAAAAATIASGTAHADDITIDNTPFVSSRSRAEGEAELLRPSALARSGGGEWARQYNQVPAVKSTFTSEQAKADYKSSRDYVSALNGEDSGSSYFLKGSVPPNATSMGGPAR
jgi:hypothetical protein